MVGKPPERDQDSFMYRDVNGLLSLLLDDDSGEYYATLNLGYAMDQDRLEVDYSYDIRGTSYTSKGLTLYFRADAIKTVINQYGPEWRLFWWFPARFTWQKSEFAAHKVTDVLRDPYGTCSDG